MTAGREAFVTARAKRATLVARTRVVTQNLSNYEIIVPPFFYDTSFKLCGATNAMNYMYICRILRRILRCCPIIRMQKDATKGLYRRKRHEDT